MWAAALWIWLAGWLTFLLQLAKRLHPTPRMPTHSWLSQAFGLSSQTGAKNYLPVPGCEKVHQLFTYVGLLNPGSYKLLYFLAWLLFINMFPEVLGRFYGYGKNIFCVEGLVVIPLFLCKCTSADFLKGFLCLCVWGVSSWLGELCFPEGPYLATCRSQCSCVQPTLKFKTKGLD